MSYQKQRLASSLPLQQPFLDPGNDLDEKIYNRFVALLGGEENSLANELVAEFLHDVPDYLATLRHAVHSSNEGVFFAVLRALRTSSAAIGAWYLASLCREMEQAAKADGLEAATVRFRQIEKAFERIRIVLQHKIGVVCHEGST
jgi:HPt (histidine-containing phosphotransfer) domain-containing protein